MFTGEILPGLFYWSKYNAAIQTDMGACFVRGEKENVLVDPFRPEFPHILDRWGKPKAVLLTTANHERDSALYCDRYAIECWAHEEAAAHLKRSPDRTFQDGNRLPGGLKAIQLSGASPGETAFFSEQNSGILIIGDALYIAKGHLTFLPDQYCADAKQARSSVKRLVRREFDALILTHGPPILSRSKAKLQILLRGKG